MVDRGPTRGRQVARPKHAPWEGADSSLARATLTRGGTRLWLPPAAIGPGIGWALFALACQNPTPPLPPSDTIGLTIGVPQSRQLDPRHGVSAVADFLRYERLTSNDASGRTVARLLESWSVQADGLTWNLRLRPGIKFQDGTPLAAADVKRSIEQARERSGWMTSSVCWPDVWAIDTPSDLDVVVRLRRRCFYLLDDLDPAITRGPPSQKPVGTGPFVAVSSSENEYLFKANRQYYLGPPAVGNVVVRSYDTLRTAWVDMMRGRVDFLWEVGPDTAEFLRDQASVAVRSFPSYYSYSIVLNSARPPFRDPVVRRALNIAVDRAELIQLGLKGMGLPADDPVWPSYWARASQVANVAYDPARAAGMLRTLPGVAPAAAGDRSAFPAARIAFTCLVPANFTIYERLALLVQRQLRAIDVEMRIESLPINQFLVRVQSGDFDAALLNMVGGPYSMIQYRFWHSPGARRMWNVWDYRNASVDAALEAMRDAPDDGAFRAAMARFTSAVHDDPPAIFLAWSETVQAVSRRFELPAVAKGRDAIYSLNRWRPHGEAERLP